MFAVSFRTVCLCLFLQIVTGKSLNLQYAYEEIEDPFQQINQEETRQLEFDHISDDAIEEICKHFKVTIHIRRPESVVNCLESIFDKNRSVVLVKREAEELEGSGDTDVATSATPSAETHEEEQTNGGVENESEITSDPNQESAEPKVELPPAPEVQVPEETKVVEETPASSEEPQTQTDNPGSFQGGFDKILNSIPREQNITTKDVENSDVILTSASDGQLNVKPDAETDGEEAKTGESKEQPTAASPNSMLLIVIAALGVIGAVAFVFNFVKSRRESKEIDEVVRLETEGKELKEMKPLMKSPLAQNGAKSMEYIDADPQIQVPTETRVEVNRDHNSE